MMYGKARRYNMPVLIPAATLLPACLLDATPAAQTLHCANDSTGNARTIRVTTMVLINFMVQIYTKNQNW